MIVVAHHVPPPWLANVRTWFEAATGFVLLHLPAPPPRWNLLSAIERLISPRPRIAEPTRALPEGVRPLNLFQQLASLAAKAEQNPWLLSEGKDDVMTLVAAASGDKAAVAADLKKDIDDLPIPAEWKSLSEADVLVNAAADFRWPAWPI